MNDKLVFIQELLVFELVFVAVNDDARSWSSFCVFEILFFGRCAGCSERQWSVCSCVC